MSPRAVASVLVVALLAGGCVWPFGRKNEDQSEEPAPEPITLRVTNHNWSDVVIYVLPSGSRIRLGSVVTGQQADFVLPLNYTPNGVMSLLVDPIGSRETFRTGNILVSPGQQVELVIENQLSTSSWSVAELRADIAPPAVGP
ncbi:MAG TPA: hypothetical protein VFQ38_04360 [Longimicrobiales bacterium]|nr:hypothetical protein [Longimicrobiales bacterium]